jgi:hypothetical protein
MCGSCMHEYENIARQHWDALTTIMQKVDMLEAMKRDNLLTFGEILAKNVALGELRRGES